MAYHKSLICKQFVKGILQVSNLHAYGDSYQARYIYFIKTLLWMSVWLLKYLLYVYVSDLPTNKQVQRSTTAVSTPSIHKTPFNYSSIASIM